MPTDGDIKKTGDAVKEIISTARTEILEKAGHSGLFPNGVTSIDVHLKVDGQSGIDAGLTIRGPDCACVQPKDSRQDTLEMTPTASWWFNNGRIDVVAAVSLWDRLEDLPPAPPNSPWRKRTDHWFQLKPLGGENLATLLPAQAGAVLTLEVRNYDPDVVTPGLAKDALNLRTTWEKRQDSDASIADSQWVTTGLPNFANAGVYYYEGVTHASQPQIRFGLMFTVNEANQLTGIRWFTDTKFTGLAPTVGTPYYLTCKTLTAWPNFTFHYP